jgi:hypothetical protein
MENNESNLVPICGVKFDSASRKCVNQWEIYYGILISGFTGSNLTREMVICPHLFFEVSGLATGPIPLPLSPTNCL